MFSRVMSNDYGRYKLCVGDLVENTVYMPGHIRHVSYI